MRKDLIVDIKPKHLKVGLKGSEPIIDGELDHKIKPDDSTWLIEDSKRLIITFAKLGE